MGFTPDRELPIVGKIAMGSLFNKFVLLLPGALLLSAFAPWAVTPLLMLGGAYLCFEAAEKVIEAIRHEDHADTVDELALGSKELEKQKIAGAIRTDLILSAEIMAIALSEVADRSLALQAAALAVVALAITVAVYGVVALIVKMDDIGLHMAAGRNAASRKVGEGLVRGMPVVLSVLATVGTGAMLWVGGGILVHGLEHYHLTPLPMWIHDIAAPAQAVPGVGGLLGWAVTALLSGLVGLTVGGVIAGALHLIPRKH
jgi:predicted DNA repair protein MutK